ncbi:proto-oncogene c-Fos-like isoform X3 [Gadus morhua]|uniref:proto-oncogene c-Fos-like isoform X3 n=1 Tax=Gadus morhua TaxID=8049 RepID=UPI0011B4565C|nr:proto-oncogene c-Fos-like isoform X3 [Gadus morhua]
MYVNSLPPDMDTASACSTESSDGINTFKKCEETREDAGSTASSPEDNVKELCQDMDTQVDSFIPTVTAIATTPDFQWMVQPTIITSVSQTLGSKPANSVQSSPRAASKLSPADEEKKKVRRERNKMAAAKCRNRRRELTDTLQAETDILEEEGAALELEIANLLKEKERLEDALSTHKPMCQLPEELGVMFRDATVGGPPDFPPGSPSGEDRLQEDGGSQDGVLLQDGMDAQPSDPSAAISGDSDILLCASAEISGCDLEPSLEVKEGALLDELVSGLEDDDGAPMETGRSVPDIDLSSSLGVSDWETLYKSVSGDLEPLSTPVVTSTPTCNSYLSVFTFACPELDALPEGMDGVKGGAGKTESGDLLNSPTLLAL